MGTPYAAIQQAEQPMRERLDAAPRTIEARYDCRTSRITVSLSNVLELAFPPHLAEGKPADLAAIEITPTDPGLHWPKLGADSCLPALRGVLGSPRWRAGLLREIGRLGAPGCPCAHERPQGK